MIIDLDDASVEREEESFPGESSKSDSQENIVRVSLSLMWVARLCSVLLLRILALMSVCAYVSLSTVTNSLPRKTKTQATWLRFQCFPFFSYSLPKNACGMPDCEEYQQVVGGMSLTDSP